MVRTSRQLVPIGELPDVAPESAPAGWSKALYGEAALAAVLVCIAVAMLMATSAKAYLAIPFSDAHDWIARVFALERAHDWLGYLWAPHTNQRIPTARLVEALDIEVVRGRGPSFLLAGAAAMLMGGAAGAVLLARSRIDLRLKLWLACAAGVLLANTALAEDFAFPVFTVYLFVAGPALAAVCAFSLPTEGGLRAPAFWIALVCATLASFGNAAGLAVWPALAGLAVMQGRRGAEVGVLVVVALVVGVGIEAGLGAPSSSLGAATGSPIDHLAKMIAYFAAFGGLPWSRALHPTLAATVFGLAIWAFAGWTLSTLQPWREDGAAALTKAGAALILFAFVTAALAAVGRVDELPQPIAPTRYTPFAALLQIGVVLASTRRLQALEARGRWWVVGLSVALAVFVLASDVHGAQVLVRTADRIRAASVAFDQGRTPEGAVIHPRPDFARSVRLELKRRGLAY